MSVPDTPFWSYSVTTYGQDAVAGECLTLQDRFGLDVNIVLLCCWLGSRGTALDHAQTTHVIEFTDAWASSVIAPLRAIRRRLKQDIQDEIIATFRAEIAALELAAEKIQQTRLFDTFGTLPADPAAAAMPTAARNLANYVAIRNQPPDTSLRDSLVKLLHAAFPDAPEVDIVSCLAVSASDQTI